MANTTPDKSRSGKKRRKSEQISKSQKAIDGGLAVELALQGRATLDVRGFVKKLKWPAAAICCGAFLLYAPKVDIQLDPGASHPIQVHVQR